MGGRGGGGVGVYGGGGGGGGGGGASAGGACRLARLRLIKRGGRPVERLGQVNGGDRYKKFRGGRQSSAAKEPRKKREIAREGGTA